MKAVSVDPNYAIAHSGLADCYNMLGYYSYLQPSVAFAQAEAAARQAIGMDDGIAEAHASLGFFKLFHQWDWAGAEQEFKRALEIDPNYAMANHWYGISLAPLGRPFEAALQIRKAWAQEPSSPVSNTYVAGSYYFARQYDRAIEKCAATLQTDPDFSPARQVRGCSYRQKSMLDEAMAEFTRVLKKSEKNVDARAALGHLYGVAGDRKRARKVLADLKSNWFPCAGQIALVHLGLGEMEETLVWLRKALQDRYPGLVFLKLDPVFDSLQSDSRFQQLAQDVGLR